MLFIYYNIKFNYFFYSTIFQQYSMRQNKYIILNLK